ncbi:MAG TPA: nitroreductase family protein, partial [Streptomyces sp.]|nr:nitroreductase family protein [Streptomyces sp.]
RADHSIALRADFERSMPHADPQMRALHLGCGAALFNLRVAAQHAGFRPSVKLLPDPDDQQTLASVTLVGASESLDHDLSPLYSAIPERRTSRYPFAERPIPTALENLLVDQARSEGSRMAFLTGWHLQLVLELIEEAELNTEHDGDQDEELWVRTGVTLSDTTGNPVDPAKREDPEDLGMILDGVPEYSLGPRRYGGRAPVRDFARGREHSERDSEMFEHMPHLGLIYTEHDHPVDWLVAGQAMERVLLVATREGLASSFATQALERPELRWLLRDPVWGAGPVQMVIRLGYGPLGSRTPRRDVRDALEILP